MVETIMAAGEKGGEPERHQGGRRRVAASGRNGRPPASFSGHDGRRRLRMAWRPLAARGLGGVGVGGGVLPPPAAPKGVVVEAHGGDERRAAGPHDAYPHPPRAHRRRQPVEPLVPHGGAVRHDHLAVGEDLVVGDPLPHPDGFLDPHHVEGDRVVHLSELDPVDRLLPVPSAALLRRPVRAVVAVEDVPRSEAAVLAAPLAAGLRHRGLGEV